MNVKYYVRGLGAGLIISAATMMITGAVTGGSESDTKVTQQTTAGSVIAYTTSAETTQEQENTESAKDETTAQQTTVEMTTAQQTTQAQETTAEATTTQSETEKQTEIKSSMNDDGTVEITIHNVYYATQASAILLDAGVITDAQGFTDYLVNSGYASKIREGVYTVTPGASFETIAKIITQG